MSAGIQLIEPVVDALRARLATGLPAEVALANADYSDGTVVEDPAQVLDYCPPPTMLTAFPTVGILHGSGTFEDDIGSSATGRYQMTVVAYVQDADQQALARKLRRYARCVARVALDDRNLAPAAWGTVLVRADYGPTLADNPEDPRVYMSWVGVTLEAKADEA